jgi:hypothetical protein
MIAPEHLDRLRQICLGFPEAAETAGVGSPSFKVRDKIFAMHHPFDGGSSLWCKAPPGFQEMVIGADPEHFFVPPYVGHHGWIGIRLADPVDWEHVGELVERSYRLTAPKRLIALIKTE